MRIKYLHKLEYKYEDPVQLGEHRLCINFELKITPEPEIIYPLLAASGEEISRIRFNGLTDNLIIQSISEVETTKHPNIIDGVKNRDLTLPFCRSIINRDLQRFTGSIRGMDA